MSRSPAKSYDERYFKKWYGGRRAIASPDQLRRRVHLVVAAAEHVLDRRVRSVLDVGCGEGRWRAVLRRLRPELTYVGVDGSDWVVKRWGRRRGILKGTFGELAALRLRRRFDLIVCSDVVHYLTTAELRRGLGTLRGLAGGLLWMDAFTTGDEFEGDTEGWRPRSARSYRRVLAAAGFAACGLGCWLPDDLHHRLTALERGG